MRSTSMFWRVILAVAGFCLVLAGKVRAECIQHPLHGVYSKYRVDRPTGRHCWYVPGRRGEYREARRLKLPRRQHRPRDPAPPVIVDPVPPDTTETTVTAADLEPPALPIWWGREVVPDTAGRLQPVRAAMLPVQMPFHLQPVEEIAPRHARPLLEAR